MIARARKALINRRSDREAPRAAGEFMGLYQERLVLAGAALVRYVFFR